uniref:Retrotransposon Copia-like N-terminal domain-containing protein n=1 Tax=Setaria italica TaxID=4555 RepID=K3Y219_SETIT
MAQLINKDFTELAADGSNYLTWAMDVKLVLQAKGFIGTLNEPNPQAPILEAHKKLWDSLKERYNQQQSVILLEARREWSVLHLMDFKSVAEYNYAVHKICSKLRFCNQPLDDAEMIEKTLSTFLPANRILQQQYRRYNYTKYSDLIYDLFKAEKHDELLTKNHQLRPMGVAPPPEFVKGVVNHTTRKCHTAKHLVDLYQKYAGKQVHGTSLKRTSLLNLLTPVAPKIIDDMLVDSTDDMLVDFQSNNMFGDMN